MLQVDTKKAGSLNDLGLTYQKQEKYDKAIEYYDRALEVESEMFSNKAICVFDIRTGKMSRKPCTADACSSGPTACQDTPHGTLLVASHKTKYEFSNALVTAYP